MNPDKYYLVRFNGEIKQVKQMAISDSGKFVFLCDADNRFGGSFGWVEVGSFDVIEEVSKD